MKLNQRTKSKKGLFAVTALTLVAVLSVLMVYAAIIYNFTGGEVVVGGEGSSTITYSADNNADGTWTSTLQSASVSDPWYSRLEVSAGDYSGPVTITWKLQQKTATWTDVPSASTTTSIILSGDAENVYASSNGANATNLDWKTYATSAGTYRVIVTVESD